MLLLLHELSASMTAEPGTGLLGPAGAGMTELLGDAAMLAAGAFVSPESYPPAVLPAGSSKAPHVQRKLLTQPLCLPILMQLVVADTWSPGEAHVSVITGHTVSPVLLLAGFPPVDAEGATSHQYHCHCGTYLIARKPHGKVMCRTCHASGRVLPGVPPEDAEGAALATAHHLVPVLQHCQAQQLVVGVAVGACEVLHIMSAQ